MLLEAFSRISFCEPANFFNSTHLPIPYDLMKRRIYAYLRTTYVMYERVSARTLNVW
jgi:hypothetical protein